VPPGLTSLKVFGVNGLLGVIALPSVDAGFEREPEGVIAAKVYVKEVVQLNLKNVKIKSVLI